MALLKEQQQIDIFAPVVPDRGMCSLKSASKPIFEHLRRYAKAHPEKPICIMGVSNGSRIATKLEVKLQKHAPTTPVRVSTIAGVHYGSSRMGLVKALGIAKWMYPKELMMELSYGSECATRLLNRVKAPLPGGCFARSYEFFATTEDQSVPDLYRRDLKNRIFGGAKAPQFVDLKWPHIFNIRPLEIGKFRKLSRCPKPIFEVSSV